jgi:precorrin-4/cobalt-precorrin-4 C11-methyltransferase
MSMCQQRGNHVPRVVGSWVWLMAVAVALAVGTNDRRASAAPAAEPQVLTVRGLGGESTTLSPEQFAQLPRTTLEAPLPHSDKTAVFEGVLLEHVLAAAHVQPGDAEKNTELSRPFRAAYVLVEAADGYQVVFSIPEVFAKLGGGRLLVADRQDGEPLPAKAAPYQIIVDKSVGYERWIRQVTHILVQPAIASSQDSPAVPSPPAEDVAAGVYVLGTGPGAPDLITVRAANVLRRAERVFCFDWMKDELTPFVREGVIEVASPLLRGGQLCGQDPATCPPELRQSVLQTNEALTRLKACVKALTDAGKTVVFADNGDPTIFSPWNWVPAQLAEFSPTVVPGLSSFNAANAALKRGITGSGAVIISSGTELATPDSNGRLNDTLVLFTHRKKLDELLPALQQRYPADTPVAVVYNVSYPGERIFEGTLQNIRDVIGDQSVLPHLYLLYVGDGLRIPGCGR